MLKLLVVLAFYFSTQYCSAVGKKTSKQPTLNRNKQFNHTHLRVHGGRDLNDKEYSFAVVLFKFDDESDVNRLCTASLITENWALTAGHCEPEAPIHIRPVYVWYGNYTTQPSESKMYSLVLDIVRHPGYYLMETWNNNNMVLNNDICLLRVSGIPMQSYGRLSSVDYTTLVGLPVVYVGGGFTGKSGDDEVRPLQVGESVIVACDKEFRGETKFLICATPKCSQRFNSATSGDSGGPLLYDDKIIGVSSFGVASGLLSYDGYSPVSPNIDWIHEVIKPRIEKNVRETPDSLI